MGKCVYFRHNPHTTSIYTHTHYTHMRPSLCGHRRRSLEAQPRAAPLLEAQNVARGCDGGDGGGSSALTEPLSAPRRLRATDSPASAAPAQRQPRRQGVGAARARPCPRALSSSAPALAVRLSRRHLMRLRCPAAPGLWPTRAGRSARADGVATCSLLRTRRQRARRTRLLLSANCCPRSRQAWRSARVTELRTVRARGVSRFERRMRARVLACDLRTRSRVTHRQHVESSTA